MQLMGNVAAAVGLPARERETLSRLLEVFARHQAANARKRRYYEGHVTLGEVNLGLALPKGMDGLEIGCAWGEKCVDVLAARSMFDGFVGKDGQSAGTMARIVEENRLLAEYRKACRDELKYGCTFAALSADRTAGCRIRFHSPETAAAEWDGQAGRIGAGFCIVALAQMDLDRQPEPSVIHLHTDEAVWVLRRSRYQQWTAEEHSHAMGRPLMEPLVWNATSGKPFGRSRLKKPVRELIRGYVRTVANATIGLEFSTAPQKYLLGVTDAQYDAVIDRKFQTYVGSMLVGTTNPDTGENPSYGQLPQGNLKPHVDMLRMLSTQFSAATGLTVTDVGVVNDANPTSSDAILAQSQTLILLAEELNAANGASLNAIARMAQAIARDVAPEELTEEERDVVAHFKNPAMPSVAVTADAAVKLAAAREGFGQTDVFLEMVGFDQADIRRIRAQEARSRGLAMLTEVLNDESVEA